MFTKTACALFLLGLVLLTAQARQDDIIYIDREQPTDAAAACRRFHSIVHYGGEVCARDGATYPNVMFVNCCNRHLPARNRIEVVYPGACKNETEPAPACEKNMLFQPVCGSDNETYANIEALNCKRVMVPGYDVRLAKRGECASIRCPCRRPDPSKVCASNGLTYSSVGEVRCLQRFNPSLTILHSGGCTVREVRRSQGRRFACHLAKNRYEWNPVCGKNNLTYANPYIYICHHPPGEGKCAAKPGECGTLTQLACSRADSINHHRLQASALVCGSNGVTYRSYEHLHCATANDRYLEAVSTGKCTRAYDPCLLTIKPLFDRGEPVCGTDNLSYSSMHSLWCIKHLGKKDLKFKHDGPCL